MSYEIFDRNAEVGGTWYTTTYPGIGVDTPSAYYSLSREVNPDWSSYYPQGAEYQAYLVALADKHKLRAHTRFRHRGRGAVVGRRAQTVADPFGQRRRCGATSAMPTSWSPPPATSTGRAGPTVKGRDTFAGISIHSASVGSRRWTSPARRWRSSGPAAPPCRSSTRASTQVEHLTVFQRQPHWVAPRRRLTDEVPAHKRYLGRHLPYYANWNRLKSYLGHRGQQLPGHPAGPGVGQGSSVHLCGQRRAAADVPGVHRADFRQRTRSWPRRSPRTSHRMASGSSAIRAATTRR